MISKPNFGWAHWELPNFVMPISYIQDFATDILKTMKDYLITEECQQIEINAEEDFYVIYLGYPVYAQINDGDIIKICDDVLFFISQIVKDIEKNIDEWADFCNYDDSADYKEKTKEYLQEEIKSIKSLINN